MKFFPEENKNGKENNYNGDGWWWAHQRTIWMNELLKYKNEEKKCIIIVTVIEYIIYVVI